MANGRRSTARREADPDADPDAPRARAFWSGTITFGLVSIPVELHPASRSVHTTLRTLGPEGTPLGRRYFDPESGKEVPSTQVERGFEIEKGRYVIVEDEELEALAPRKSRDIELQRFVPADSVDPFYFERAYLLVPTGGAVRAYRLLAAVMEETGRAGIATFVMRGHEYLVAVFSERGILSAETLRFADEIRTPETIGLPEPSEPKAAAVRRMEKAVTSLHAAKLAREELRDEESRKLAELVKKKLARGEDMVEVEVEERDAGEDIPDLMNVLRWSLREAGERRGGGAGGKPKARAAGGGNGSRSLEKRSKAELYERAKELGIEGRSGMSKDELVAALRRTA